MDFLDLVFIFLVGSLAARGLARLWLSTVEIGARLGRAWRALAAGPVGRFAVRHRKATITVGVLGGLVLLPFVLVMLPVVVAVAGAGEASVEDLEEEEEEEGFYGIHPETGLPLHKSRLHDIGFNPYP